MMQNKDCVLLGCKDEITQLWQSQVWYSFEFTARW